MNNFGAFRKSLTNPHYVTIGKTGGGTFCAKSEIANIMSCSNDDVIVIDPDNEYEDVARALGGDNISILAGGNTYINPLDMAYGINDFDKSQRNRITDKAEFLHVMFGWLRNNVELTAEQAHVIDATCKMIFEPYFKDINKIKNFNPQDYHVPDIRDFWAELQGQTNPAASELAQMLVGYLSGSLSIFTKETNVNIERQFTVYDIHDLGYHDIPLGMLILLEHIRTRVINNNLQQKRTWVYVEQIDRLLQCDHITQYAYNLLKMARPYGAIFTGMLHDDQALSVNNYARMVLSSCNERFANDIDIIESICG